MRAIVYITEQYNNACWWQYIPIIAILHILVKEYRTTQNGGGISFGEAFSLCFRLSLFCFIIGAIFNMVNMQYISPNTFTAILQYKEQQYIAEYYYDEEQLTTLMKIQYYIVKYPFLQAFAASIVVSLFIALLLKKKKQPQLHINFLIN